MTTDVAAVLGAVVDEAANQAASGSANEAGDSDATEAADGREVAAAVTDSDTDSRPVATSASASSAPSESEVGAAGAASGPNDFATEGTIGSGADVPQQRGFTMLGEAGIACEGDACLI